jgi:hypothetical protein
MERMKANGNLHRVLLGDEKGKIVGWYIYYGKVGTVAEVGQIGGTRQSIKDILDHLFYHRWSNRAGALNGVGDRT